MSSGVEPRQKTREGGGGKGRGEEGEFDKTDIVESNALGGGAGRDEARRERRVTGQVLIVSFAANSYIVVPSFLSR
jgi:hypothetical protein